MHVPLLRWGGVRDEKMWLKQGRAKRPNWACGPILLAVYGFFLVICADRRRGSGLSSGRACFESARSRRRFRFFARVYGDGSGEDDFLTVGSRCTVIEARTCQASKLSPLAPL